MGLLERIAESQQPERANNDTTSITMTDWSNAFRPGSQLNYQGRDYQGFRLGGGSRTQGYYESDSVVFACESKRINVFSEARFQWQQLVNGRPGDLFGNKELALLENPWPGATTTDLLKCVEMDVAQFGNSYWVIDGDGYLLRLDPMNVKIITEAIWDSVTGFRVGERLVGYAYMSTRDSITIYSPEEIAHHKPIPSCNQFLGQSWISSCLPDIESDMLLTDHKRVELRTGASLAYVVSVDKTVKADDLAKFAEKFRAQYEGRENTGKTLFLGGGADIKTVSQTFGDLALAATQGATETRIAAAAGTHPVIIGLSEGMSGSSLNAGNYTAAKRNFVDGTMRPLWRAFCGAFQWLLKVPSGARLWYDDRDIAFLREDIKDQADVQVQEALTINTLILGGFDPDAVVAAVIANDFKRLIGQHTGMTSVQLQMPLSGKPAAPPAITQ